MTAPSKREQELADRAIRLTAHIYEQTRKRQYMNAACAASELVTALLGAFAEVLHPRDPKPAHPCTRARWR